MFAAFTLMLVLDVTSAPEGVKHKKVWEVTKINKGLFGFDKVEQTLDHEDGKNAYFNLDCRGHGYLKCQIHKNSINPDSPDPVVREMIMKYEDLIVDFVDDLIARADEEAYNGKYRGNYTRKVVNEDLKKRGLLFVFSTVWDFSEKIEGKQTVEFSIVKL